jgi:GH25 family lysozyme M1 (1,4-beta-N-acetylmuramidase)
MESGSGNQRGYLIAFATEVFRQYKCDTMLYSGPYFIQEHIGAEVAHVRLWVAHWGVANPMIPKGWHGWSMWQTGGAKVPGVPVSACDVDRAKTPLAVIA